MACLEQEDVGAPDEEALFASQEGAKQLTVLATGTGQKEKRSRYNCVKHIDIING